MRLNRDAVRHIHGFLVVLMYTCTLWFVGPIACCERGTSRHVCGVCGSFFFEFAWHSSSVYPREPPWRLAVGKYHISLHTLVNVPTRHLFMVIPCYSPSVSFWLLTHRQLTTVHQQHGRTCGSKELKKHEDPENLTVAFSGWGHGWPRVIGGYNSRILQSSPSRSHNSNSGCDKITLATTEDSTFGCQDIQRLQAYPSCHWAGRCDLRFLVTSMWSQARASTGDTASVLRHGGALWLGEIPAFYYLLMWNSRFPGDGNSSFMTQFVLYSTFQGCTTRGFSF